ncbi:MAG: uroporphyrinogen-III C-methyltransferase [Woeseiaceae bacterium]|nr:uroporphyrinogen-III C-methyltransferase [Woeseiaceae bacterium]
MTNDNEQPQDAEFPEESEESPAEAQEEEVRALPPPEKPVRKRTSSVAWLALIIAVLSATTAGYYLVVEGLRARQGADENTGALAELRNRVATADESLSSLDAEIDELAEADAQAAAEIDAVLSDFESRIQLLDSLPSRMSNLENSVAAIQGISTGARNTLLLAEAEYYMQLANAQLQLAANPELAALALGMADDRIVQLADPALTEVRRALADELAALDTMEKPDIEGATLTLSSLAGVVATLPLRQVGVNEGGPAASADEEQSGVDRAWESVKQAASGLVRVTPPDETAIPLLTPDAEYFLRTNLTLQLQVARLALLRGEQAVFEQSLSDADHWLRDYFDTDSAQVRGARATLEEIRGSMTVVAPPDISGSLQLLRQFNSISSGPAQ